MKNILSVLFFVLVFSLFTPIGSSAAANEHYQLWKDEQLSQSNTTKQYLEVKQLNNGTELRSQIHGYAITLPEDWELDSHQYDQYIRLFNENFRLDITYDPIIKKEKFESYLKELKNTVKTETVYTSGWLDRGYTFQRIDYKRQKLNNLLNDLNFYSYYVVYTLNGTYTFHLKTDEQHYRSLQKQVLSILDLFKIIPIQKVDLNRSASRTNLKAIEQLDTQKKLSIPLGQPVLGTYTHKAKDIYQVEQNLQTHLGAQMFYKSIPTTYDPFVKEIIQNGRIPVVTFHFVDYTKKEDIGITKQVINGDYDSYIRSWAQGFKNLNAPVLVRLSNEMNGSWTQWSLDDNDQDADLYKLAYRHFVDVIREQGAENVKFVWNPNATSAPDYSWNDASLFYPGDEYVDWVGLTHYNFGTAEWSKFLYFDDLYKNLYATYLRQFPNKPFIIGEFASAVEGGNKPYFISNYLNNIGSKYRNIRIAIWFDEIDGKYDFRIHSSEATESAFKQGVKNGKFTTYPIY